MISVCIVITGLSGGGSENSIYRLLSKLDRDRFRVHVISLSDRGIYGDQIEALGIPVTAVGMRPGAGAFLRLPYLWRVLRRIRPDLVHSVMYHASLMCSLAAATTPSIWGIHQSNLSSLYNKRSTLLVIRICAILSHWLPRLINCCSASARETHIEVGYEAGRMVVTHNGFDLDLFAPDEAARGSVRAELGLAPETPLVGLVGRNDPVKNLVGFARAAARVRKVLPGVHFALAGKGVDTGNEPLVKALAEHGLLDSFHLLGRREDIPRLMASFDVLALASHGEAFPNVLGEAMACGVPCASTAAGDAAEIIGSTGHVVPVGDMQGLAEAITGLLRLPKEERQNLGRQARDRVRNLFSLAAMVRRYEALFQEAVA